MHKHLNKDDACHEKSQPHRTAGDPVDKAFVYIFYTSAEKTIYQNSNEGQERNQPYIIKHCINLDLPF
jgi:hypothetical protein